MRPDNGGEEGGQYELWRLLEERDDFKATGALPSDTEDIVNMTLNVGGTQMAVIFVAA